MASDVQAILRLEVPLIVVLGTRPMPVEAVTALAPGSIIELPKSAEDELELLVNNKPVGTGRAVKVGENFGLRINFIGDVRQRLAAMGSGPAGPAGPPGPAPAPAPAAAPAAQ